MHGMINRQQPALPHPVIVSIMLFPPGAREVARIFNAFVVLLELAVGWTHEVCPPNPENMVDVLCKSTMLLLKSLPAIEMTE